MGGVGRSVGRRADRDCKSSPDDRDRPTDRPTAAAVAKVEWPAAMVAVAVATAAESFEWVNGGEQSSQQSLCMWCYYPLSGRRETQEGKTLLMLSPLTMEMGDVFRSFIDEHFLLVVKWIILGKK